MSGWHSFITQNGHQKREQFAYHSNSIVVSIYIYILTVHILSVTLVTWWCVSDLIVIRYTDKGKYRFSQNFWKLLFSFTFLFCFQDENLLSIEIPVCHYLLKFWPRSFPGAYDTFFCGACDFCTNFEIPNINVFICAKAKFLLH